MKQLKGVKELLNEAWSKYKEKPQLYLSLMAAPAIFAFLAVLQSSENEFRLSELVVGVILWVVQTWAMLAALSAFRDSGNKGIQAYAKEVLPRLWPSLTTGIITGLMVLGGLILLVVPGIILAISFSFYSQIVLFEGLNNWPALARSKEYTKDLRLALFWRYIAVVAIWILGAAATQLLAAVLIPTASEILTSAIVSGVLTLILQPLFSAYAYLLYENVKAVKEGAIAAQG